LKCINVGFRMALALPSSIIQGLVHGFVLYLLALR